MEPESNLNLNSLSVKEVMHNWNCSASVNEVHENSDLISTEVTAYYPVTNLGSWFDAENMLVNIISGTACLELIKGFLTSM